MEYRDIQERIPLHSSIDFKSNLRLMTILIFITLQIPLQYFSIYHKYPLPEGAPEWIKHFIIAVSVLYLALEILEYKLWNYRYAKRTIPLGLFSFRTALLLVIILAGKYSPDHTILSMFIILLVFYSYDAFAFPLGLTLCILTSGTFFTLGLIDVYRDDSQYPVIVTTYRSLIMVLFYLFAYFWNKDREYSDRNRALVEELNTSEKNLQEYARRVGQTAALEERTRLARDIHDSVGHALTAIQIQLSKAEAYFSLNQEESRQAVVDANKTAKDAMTDVRESLNILNSDKNISFSIERELKPLLDTLTKAGHSITWNIEGDYSTYNYAVLITLFRVIQEGVTNILKHAGICDVYLNIDFGRDKATCILKDTGSGFKPADAGGDGHFGLNGLANRVALVRGSFKINSSPGTGCTLTTVLPKDPVSLIGYDHG